MADTDFTLDWLTAPLMYEGRLVREGISLKNLSDADLPEICLRMWLVLESIEFRLCEGRMIDTEIFDMVDKLESNLLHNELNLLVDWRDAIDRFGRHYDCEGKGPIKITHHAIESCQHNAQRLGLKLGVEGENR